MLKKELVCRLLLTICFAGVLWGLPAQYDPERVQKWRRDWRSPETPDRIRFLAADRLAMYLHKNDLDSALYYVEKQIAFSQKKKNNEWIAESLSNKAKILKLADSYLKAREAFQKALGAQKKINDAKGIAYTYKNIAYLLRKEGKLSEALKYYQLSIDTAEQLGEEGGPAAAAAFNGMGSLYLDQKDYDKALEYYQRSLSLHLSINKKTGVAANYNNISQVYYFLQDYDRAMEYLERSRIIKQKLNNFSGLGNTYHNLGDLAVKAGKLNLANEHYQKALFYRDSLGHKGDMAASYNALGSNAIRIDHYSHAISYCQKGLRLAQEVGDVEEAAANADCLYRAFEQVEQVDSALFYHVLHTALEDSLYNQENTRKLTAMELEYQHEKEKAIMRAELRWQQLIRNVMLGAGGLLLLLVYLIYRINRVRAKKNRELELKNQQIEEDRTTIAQQAEDLRALDEMKSRFFANISHELRTPATLISTPIAFALDRYQDTFRPEVKRILTLARKNAQKLIHLVEELLELSRIESGKLDLIKTPIYLPDFLSQLISAYESTAGIKSIDLGLDCQLSETMTVLLDKRRVSKIINNLLSNALKFTPERGAVLCKVNIEKMALGHLNFGNQAPGLLKISVSDTGRGIPEDELGRVFDRFYQVQNEGQPLEGGAGVGLALSKELALLMNGNLVVESAVGKGSTFTLMLPLEIAEEKPPLRFPSAPESQPAKSGAAYFTAKPAGETATSLHSAEASHVEPVQAPEHKLLIVEDNLDMQQLLRNILEEHYQCTIANNGQEAWGMLQRNDYTVRDFDLILSDVMMPEMDGYTLLENIKAHDEWKQLPIVLLTARAGEDDKLKALRLGVDDYLPKPFSSVELMARIENLIANYEQRKELKKLGIELNLEAPPSSDDKWLSELEKTCLTALDQQININNIYLSSQLNISERQLLRRIKSLTGLSVKKYVQEVKLQKARNLLEHRAYPTVAEVAYKCGFNTPAYFSNVFEKRYGKRPVDYLSGQ